MCVVFICKVAWFEATVYTALLSVINENYSETTKKKKKKKKKKNALNLISMGNMLSQNTTDSRIVLINKQPPAVSGVNDNRITLFKNGK